MEKSTKKAYLESHKGVSLMIGIVSAALVLFQLYTGLFGSLDSYLQRAVHLGFGLVICFLLAVKNSKGTVSKILNSILVIGAAAVTLYPLLRYDWVITQRFPLISPMSPLEIFLAVAVIVLTLIATYRVAGTGLVVVALIFLLYPFAGPYLPGPFHSTPITFTELLDFLYLGTSGIYGTPIGVSATDIALYIVFGAILVKSGGSELINNLAGALTGSSRGGSAKVAVVASALMGTISGSGTSTVSTVGVVTIPMMKKDGYDGEFSAAVEAVASTGGQIMPPIMGATAFVMSAFAGIPYITIIRYAIFPAILYFLGLFVAVHLRAVRLNLKGTEVSATVKETMKNYGHMLIPVVALLTTLIIGFTPRMAAGVSVVAALFASELRAKTRLGIWGILEAFEDGARGLLMVIVATATAGLIVGTIDLTALGQRMGSVFMFLGGGRLWLTLVLAMLLAILLGMGMPTTPAYIIQVSTVIPALITLGVPAFVAHMFAFYFSCLSLITPPVAITSYAAATIAQANMWKTGWLAFRLGLPAYIVPFMFVYGPSILLVGTVGEIIPTVVTALIGVCALAIACEGYLWRPLKLVERAIGLVAAILLIAPSLTVSLVGAVITAALFAINYATRSKAHNTTPL